jgi:WD40 repeat protein/serine/threonine protein kinase
LVGMPTVSQVMPDDTEREKEIFGEALELGSLEEQRAFVKGACGNDESLRQAVEGLLEAYSQAGGFIPPRTSDPAAVPHDSSSGEGPGAVIGRYKLLQKIGEGGMGVVFMAEQEEPVRRRVALKIIKLGMDTQQVVARFEAERQALALMDHPNIAKVLDGGATDTGRPYFVMELVQGVPITEFCDKNRLPAEERIKLFILVCQAIQSAHQKGIIHRDIKPTNILVTLNAGVPVPMVIDFGVAKATQQKLTEKTVFTNYATMIGTPAYMSPEQAEISRLDVDTRSDIYGLGVLLYELLTGTTPFPEKRLRSASYQEMQRIIMEEEPERPSTRLRQKSSVASTPFLLTSYAPLSTDLDWIVMKCLEKDRARRYETANGLAADLKRHLNNELVVARPPSASYRLQKAFRRNKLVFSAGVAVVLALVIGLRLAGIGWRQAREEKAESEHQLYAAKMNLAQRAWEENDIDRLRELLTETQDSEYRGFEWYYWQPLTHLALKTLAGHLNIVWSVAFSPDGQRIVTGSWDQTAKVWDAATGLELLTLKGPSGYVYSVAFSPDGQRIVTGSSDNTPRVWDAASGKVILTLEGHSGRTMSVAYSPDGERIVTGSDDGTAKVWDAASGHELLTLEGTNKWVRSVAFSPDGKRIVTGSLDHTAKVWDAASGKELAILKGHGADVWSVAFSHDGQRIVTCSGDKTARVWDAASAQELLRLKGYSGYVYSAAFSPDGKWIVVGCQDHTAKVWDAASGEELFTLKGHKDRISSVAFSPNGQRILTGSTDHTAKIWETAKGLSADNMGGSLVTLKGPSSTVMSIAVSPDGERIVTSSEDQTAKVWEAASGRELLTLKGHGDRINSVDFSPDGQRIITGSEDHTAKVWDGASGHDLLTLNGHSEPINSVAFSPDGLRIVTGSSDQTAKVWNAASGHALLTLEGHNKSIAFVSFSPDGQRIMTGSYDNTAKVWDTVSGHQLLTLKGHSGWVMSVAFSPDGQRIVTGSDDDTAKVWDATSGHDLLTLKGHGDTVTSAAFSPDGQRIVTGSYDWTAKVWEAATGRELLTLKGHSDTVASVAFSPDGRRIVTGSYDGTAKVWEAATAKQVAAWLEEERVANEYVAALRQRQANDDHLKKIYEIQTNINDTSTRDTP